MSDSLDRVIKTRRIEYGNRGSIPFDDLLQMLREKKTFNQIARHFGVSRERIRQIHFEYFADIIPVSELKKYHAERRRANREEFLALNRKELMKGKDSPLLRLAKRVEEIGLSFGLIEGNANIYMRKTVLINGRRTRFLIGNVTRRKGATYNRVTIARRSLQTVEFVVAYMPDTGRFYVYPSAQIEKIYASISEDVLCWYPDGRKNGKEYLEKWDLFKI